MSFSKDNKSNPHLQSVTAAAILTDVVEIVHVEAFCVRSEKRRRTVPSDVVDYALLLEDTIQTFRNAWLPCRSCT